MDIIFRITLWAIMVIMLIKILWDIRTKKDRPQRYIDKVTDPKRKKRMSREEVMRALDDGGCMNDETIIAMLLLDIRDELEKLNKKEEE